MVNKMADSVRGILQFVGDPEVMKKQFKPLLVKGMEGQMNKWHKTTLPFHFDQRAAAVYGYARRSRKYLEQKLRKVGHTISNVLTGLMKQMVTSRIIIKVTATGKKATGGITGPRYLFVRPTAGSNQPNKAAELTDVTQKEATTLARGLDGFMTKELNDLKQTREIRA